MPTHVLALTLNGPLWGMLVRIKETQYCSITVIWIYGYRLICMHLDCVFNCNLYSKPAKRPQNSWFESIHSYDSIFFVYIIGSQTVFIYSVRLCWHHFYVVIKLHANFFVLQFKINRHSVGYQKNPYWNLSQVVWMVSIPLHVNITMSLKIGKKALSPTIFQKQHILSVN